MRFLAVDIGASSGRTIVGTVEKGRIDLEETYRFENGMKETRDGKRWEIGDLVAKVKQGIQASGRVDGIGIDTWGVDYGLIDAGGTLLDLPFAYRDLRHQEAMPEVYKAISKTRLYGRTGMQELVFNTIFQLAAEKMKRPEMLRRAARMLMMPELITFLLTGVAAGEYSICSTTGLLDARKRDWDLDLIRTLGLPERIFGTIHMPGARAGAYNGAPVYLPAMHDTGSAVAAVPAAGGGDWAYLSSGTWSLIGAELDEPVLTAEAAEANFTNEGGVDGKIRFLKNINGLWLIQECRRIWAQQGKPMEFSQIAAAAETSDFSATVDPNAPRFFAPANMVQEIVADLTERSRPLPQSEGDVARCCYLSLAQAYKRELDRLQAVTGKRFTRLHIVGGGSRAELLNQMAADAVGVPVHAGPVEATALGNLCVQARACGLFGSLQEIRSAIAGAFPIEVYEPSG
ncbi:MAG: rhamnulokinase [Planctomycetota bacterium]|nr:rhamnulokinase [Planctomycetota bacterium]